MLLRSDPLALAPERLLVFEVKGSISSFVKAVNRVPGLELVDEEDLPSDEDKQPVAYLLVPDMQALREIESLWRRWTEGEELGRGFAGWRDVFSCLRDLRVWGPNDRVLVTDADILAEEIDGRLDEELVRLEIELVFRRSAAVGAIASAELERALAENGGRVLSSVRHEDIAYHAVLAELPVAAVRAVIERLPEGLAGAESILHIRPQSVASEITATDLLPSDPLQADGAASVFPILALIDGVPVAAHPLLRPYLTVEDQFGLEPDTVVSERVHGSAMASLIIHGDRNKPEHALPRQIHCIPVLGAKDRFPSDQLIVDLIYRAVVQMKEGREASAPHVIIVNISLGNVRRPFYGQQSPWARLLDRLAYRYGILFLVSAGNVTAQFPVNTFANRVQFEDAGANQRTRGVLSAIGDLVGERRLLSPSETMNGLTIGARNIDWVSAADRGLARANINPYTDIDTANPSSALGPGFAGSVKPDILMPGGCEHLRVVGADGGILVVPAGPSRGAGLKVAAPPRQAIEAVEGFTNGTSAATALASRTAHRIHDALEATYGEEFLQLSNWQRAVLIKALLVHPARWPTGTANLVRELLGPHGHGQASRQKDNIRRFLGYGVYDSDDAVSCAADRATFWCVGQLAREKSVDVLVPIPAAFGGQTRPHTISATLAWFTPVSPGRKAYRAVRMKILDPADVANLGVSVNPMQPDIHQTNRGTVYTRVWNGEQAAVVGNNMNLMLKIQREPDPGSPIDDVVPFGLAVTIAMPGELQLYEQVLNRVQPRPAQRATP
ncbi:S8 family peptidase [Ochrobactrum sp. A-1]|uniref:S8 family peptidase n=1 Tax=Ochrobactrum sp. A-1 TaxID=2920940 RepID=UPI001F0A31AE|nr:S8 family peptidase [Ochrobactrum sp. A-1]